jgi:predicted TPR repeat methyltransferase
MENFGDYAYYYDLIYANKNYKKEAETVAGLLKKYGAIHKNANILNMGCGTGKHDFELSNMGYNMTGIDMSDDMIQIAQKSKEKIDSSTNFEVADIREYEPTKKYDAVISLFHVFSYQNSNDDVKKALGTASKALNRGGHLSLMHGMVQGCCRTDLQS